MTRRPQQDFQRQLGRRLSAYSIRMGITTERTMGLKSTLSVIRSASGRLKFVLPTESPASSLGDRRGFILSLFFCHGGASCLGPNQMRNVSIASVYSRISIVPSWQQSTISSAVLLPPPSRCPRLLPPPLLSRVNVQVLKEGCLRSACGLGESD